MNMALEDFLPLLTSAVMVAIVALTMTILIRYFQVRVLTSKKAEMELRERTRSLKEEFEKLFAATGGALTGIDVIIGEPKKIVKGKVTVSDLAEKVGKMEKSIEPLLKLTTENPHFSSIEHAFLKESIDRFKEDVKDMKDDLRREIDAIKDTTKTWFTILTIMIAIVGFLTLFIPYLFKLLLGMT